MNGESEGRLLNAIAALGTGTPAFESVADSYVTEYRDRAFDGPAIGCCAIVALEIDMAMFRRRRSYAAPDIAHLRFDEHEGMAMTQRVHTRVYNQTLAALWREHCRTSHEQSEAAMIETASHALTITNARCAHR